MLKHFSTITFLFLFITVLNATEIDDYFLKFRTTGITDYQTEKEILESYKLTKLIDQLAPYYADSIVVIRQKAYYLTYKKGIREQSNKSNEAVHRLLKGCSDANGGIVGQNLGFLQKFPINAFDSDAKEIIKDLLSKRQIAHFKKLVMLAGYAGTATDILKQQLLLPDITIEKKWALSLALARQGNKECIDYCVRAAMKIPVSNELIYYILPDLIYIRQKEAVVYCIELLNSNEKLCTSSDPDKQEKILCGYYLMELLAPAIEGFPFKTDGTGSLVTDNYESALITVRSWFKDNPEFRLIKDIY